MARTRNTNLIDIELDQRSFDKAMQRIRKYEGRPWRSRVISAFIEGAKLLVAPMRRTAPRRSGRLARSIQAKLAKKSIDAVVKVNVKPRSPKGSHGHLVNRGHVTSKGNHTTPDPFVERTIDAHEGRVIQFIKEQPLDIEGANVRSFVRGLRSL